MSEITTYTTRYLGSKLKLLDWIWAESAPYLKEHNVERIVDAFAGTSIVSYMLKQKGFETISNDFLLFNYHMAKGVIENNHSKLSMAEIESLYNPEPSSDHFIEREYTDLFFPREDTIFLDNLFQAIQRLDCEYKKSIAFAAASQAILKKAPYGRFTTTTMTNIGKKTMLEYFQSVLEQFNELVMDNGKDNKAHMEDSISFMKDVDAQAVYFDPPYGGKSFSKYEHFYNFVEVYVNYWEHEPKVGKLKQVKKKESPFSYGKNHKQCLNELMANSEHVPLWIFSYNNNGGLPIEDLKAMISTYKGNIDVKEVDYTYANKLRSYEEYLIFAY